MIERIFVSILLLLALVMWAFGSSLFWIPLAMGLAFGLLFFRMENKRYRNPAISDEPGYYIVDDVKLNSEED